MKKFFEVNVSKYVAEKDFSVYRPASLNNPKDNAVMFVTDKYGKEAEALLKCNNCLVFWSEKLEAPSAIQQRHAVVVCQKAQNAYCLFFRENGISYYPKIEDYELVNGAYIAKNARIGENCVILPGAYIGGGVSIGNNCYIGTGTRFVGDIVIGDNVIIRENTVIGADGLSTNRDIDGKGLTVPQFGGVIIEDDVQIGALTVIARGAIDDTLIKKGSKIDNSVFISHNVVIEEDTFVVGETIMFGSSSTGKQAFISGNSTIRDGKHIGDKAIVGMGAVVVSDVADSTVVKGNPAK